MLVAVRFLEGFLLKDGLFVPSFFLPVRLCLSSLSTILHRAASYRESP